MNIKTIKTDTGEAIPYYQEDESGVFWILRDSISTLGIVQCDSFTDAHEICEDEFFPEADSLEEIAKDLDVVMPYKLDDLLAEITDTAIGQENYGFRPNGPRVKDVHKHGIYQKDLNGERLDRLQVKVSMFSTDSHFIATLDTREEG